MRRIYWSHSDRRCTKPCLIIKWPDRGWPVPQENNMAEDDIQDIDDAAPPVVSELCENEDKQRSSRTPLFVASGIVVVLLLLLAVYLLWFRNAASPAEEKE